LDDDFKESIERRFNGDMKAYEEWLKYRPTETIGWADIERSIKAYPNQEELALAWIQHSLGYLPERHVILPHLAFIQTLMENGRGGTLNNDTFADELLFHMKRIRNDDMRKSGWLATKVPSVQDYEFYNSYLLEHWETARTRHVNFLGFEPLVDHSMPAEISLRECFHKTKLAVNTPHCNLDFQMATITKYREIFLTEGEDTADNSELVGLTQQLAL
jgi:hypothetical protein